MQSNEFIRWKTSVLRQNFVLLGEEFFFERERQRKVPLRCLYFTAIDTSSEKDTVYMLILTHTFT